jgi:hypothetical protein
MHSKLGLIPLLMSCHQIALPKRPYYSRGKRDAGLRKLICDKLGADRIDATVCGGLFDVTPFLKMQ